MQILPDDMYDAVPDLVSSIPADAKYVAGYVDSIHFTWSQANWDRFPHAVKMTITTTGRKRANWADVEFSDLTPQQGHDLYVAGQVDGIYCNHSTWGTVQAIFRNNHEAQPPYWIAQYPGGGRILPVLNGVTAVMHQYANSNPIDRTVLTDTALAIVTGKVVDDMALTDVLPPVKLSDGNTYNLTVADVLTGLAQYIGGNGTPAAPLTAHPTGQYNGRIISIADIAAAVNTDVSLDQSEQSSLSGVAASLSALQSAVAALPSNGGSVSPITDAQVQAALSGLEQTLETFLTSHGLNGTFQFVPNA
jgi:hypothetical protein